MELTFSTPALLFPAVSLLFISYTNRFVAYANLVRRLHDRWVADGSPVVERQITNLRRRISLIRNMQVAGAISLLFAVLSMVAIHFSFALVAEVVFLAALLFMLVSLGILLWEVSISQRALNYQLNDLEGRMQK